MNKKNTISLFIVLGISTVLVYALIGVFALRKNLLVPKVQASPATCTVDDAVVITGNLNVGGSAYIGCENVSANGQSNCTNLGTSKCVVNDGFDFIVASCPSGKMVMGGGCNSSIAANLGTSRPSVTDSTGGWFCDWNGDSGEMVVYLTCCRVGN